MQMDKLPAELLQLIADRMSLGRRVLFGRVSSYIHDATMNDDVAEKIEKIMAFKKTPNYGLFAALDTKDKILANYFIRCGAHYPVDSNNQPKACVYKYTRGAAPAQICGRIPLLGDRFCDICASRRLDFIIANERNKMREHVSSITE